MKSLIVCVSTSHDNTPRIAGRTAARRAERRLRPLWSRTSNDQHTAILQYSKLV